MASTGVESTDISALGEGTVEPSGDVGAPRPRPIPPGQRPLRAGAATRFVDPGPLVAVAAAVGLYVWLAVIEPDAASYMGLSLVLSGAVPLVFAALGQMIVIGLGDIDLGNGYAVGLVNVLVAVTLERNGIVGCLLLVAFVVAYGIVGVLVAWRGLPAIIVTLGASFLWLGIGLQIAPTPAGTAPHWLAVVYAWNPPGVPLPVLISLVALLVGGWLASYSRAGLALRAAGSNRSAVENFGRRITRIRVIAYMAAGCCIVLAGLAVTGLTNSGGATASSSYTLLGVAAVILGGGEFRGGKAPVVGVVFGAIAISLVSSVLALVNVSSNLQDAAEGLVLVIAILSRRLVEGRSRGGALL